jgi:hypothetical protein
MSYGSIMKSSTRPDADMTRPDVQLATWYWDTLGEANRQVIEYMKSLTVMLWQVGPMSALTPMPPDDEARPAEVPAPSLQQAQQIVEPPARRTAEVPTRRKAAAPKPTRRHATGARSGRRSK